MTTYVLYHMYCTFILKKKETAINLHLVSIYLCPQLIESLAASVGTLKAKLETHNCFGINHVSLCK